MDDTILDAVVSVLGVFGTLTESVSNHRIVLCDNVQDGEVVALVDVRGFIVRFAMAPQCDGMLAAQRHDVSTAPM